MKNQCCHQNQKKREIIYQENVKFRIILPLKKVTSGTFLRVHMTRQFDILVQVAVVVIAVLTIGNFTGKKNSSILLVVVLMRKTLNNMAEGIEVKKGNVEVIAQVQAQIQVIQEQVIVIIIIIIKVEDEEVAVGPEIDEGVEAGKEIVITEMNEGTRTGTGTEQGTGTENETGRKEIESTE